MFATCSFMEYKPEMGGVPVRTSNGFPQFAHQLPYRLTSDVNGVTVAHSLPITYPDKSTVKWSRDEFVPAYLARLEETGVTAIRAAADRLLDQLGRPGERLVLLCFERLATKPGLYCHRNLFAAWWQQRAGEEVPELGAVPMPEIRAQEQNGLF
jgi:hypothetical protein